jgi:5'-3' exonuclease
VQVDRRSQKIRDAGAIREKFGVEPARIPDFLALVGDAADGYPGIEGIGRVTAARLVTRYGAIEDFPPEVLGERREQALLFKNLATLRTDARLFADVDELRWRGPAEPFKEWVGRLGDQRLLARALSAGQKRGQDPFSEKGS